MQPLRANLWVCFLALLLCALCAGCGDRHLAGEISDAHVRVPGTRVSLVPPSGFSIASTFSGLEHAASGSSIMVTEAAAPYGEVVKGYDRDGLKAHGMELVESENLTVGALRGVLIRVKQVAAGIEFGKYTLLFGDDFHTVIVNAAYPMAVAETMQNPLMDALGTVAFEPKLVVDPQEAVPYRVDVAGTSLSIAEAMSNSLTFTKSGAYPPADADRACLIVAGSVGEVVVEDTQGFALERFALISRGTPANVDTLVPVSVNGLSGWEVVGSSAAEQSPTGRKLMYLTILFHPKGYYSLIGTAERQHSLHVEEFRKVSGTFRLK